MPYNRLSVLLVGIGSAALIITLFELRTITIPIQRGFFLVFFIAGIALLFSHQRHFPKREDRDDDEKDPRRADLFIILFAAFLLQLIPAFLSPKIEAIGEPWHHFFFGAFFNLFAAFMITATYLKWRGSSLSGDKPTVTTVKLLAIFTLGGVLAIASSIVMVFFIKPDLDSPLVEALLSGRIYFIFATTAFLSPYFEEIFFRGLIYQVTDRSFGKIVAFLVSSSLFTLMHVPQHIGSEAALIPIALMSLVATYIRLSTGRVMPAIALHLGYNAAIILLNFGSTSP